MRSLFTGCRLFSFPAPPAVLTLLFILVFSPGLSFAQGVWTESPRRCKSLDVREFGLISDGSISEPWSEAQLILKYGPPCEIFFIGEVYIERRRGRIVERGPRRKGLDVRRYGEIVEKKQYLYWGSYSDAASLITIVGGVVVKKERIYE